MSVQRTERTNKHLRMALKPVAIDGQMTVSNLIDQCMVSFNARQLRAACRLYAEVLAQNNTRIGLSLSGALIPAGLGGSCLAPMLRLGFVDWIVSTGANLYHDIQMALGFEMHAGAAFTDDTMLRDDGVVRIHDLYFDAQALFDTDKFIRDTLRTLVAEGKLKGTVSSADIHRALGNQLLRLYPRAAVHSVVATAASLGVPLHTSASGDSGIGMNIAALCLEGVDLRIDPSFDVNETASYVYAAKRDGGKSAVVILGGGSPKNFVVQTEPHIQEVLGLEEAGHDYFMQFTDARVDTGGLSGATPSEAVSWGKIDPSQLPHAIVCYGDCTVYLPLLARYAVEQVGHRPLQKLLERRAEFMAMLK